MAKRTHSVGGVSFTLKGAERMQKKIDALAAKFPERVEGALRIEAELVMTISKREFVPVDLGALKTSGHVLAPTRKGRMVEIILAYGGAAAGYALAVHEHPSRSSPPSWEGKTINFSPAGRGPKYLELPLNAATPGMMDRISARVKV